MKFRLKELIALMKNLKMILTSMRCYGAATLLFFIVDDKLSVINYDE